MGKLSHRAFLEELETMPQPEELDVLTIKGVAELAGLSPRTVSQHILRGTMPAPDGALGRTPWWYRSTVEEWLADRRRPGRPALT
jgi:predicted DNA-binding transcriptional regulator AlpA